MEAPGGGGKCDMSTIMLVLVEPCAEYNPYLHSTYLILQRAAAIIGYQSLSFLRKSMYAQKTPL